MKKIHLSALIFGIFTLSMQSACSNAESTTNDNHSKVENYITSSNNNCKIHNPAPNDNESVTWSGNCKDGYADGDGVTTWYVDNKVFEIDTGNNIKGKLNGFVTMEVKGDFIYKGEVVDDDFQGVGTMTWENGSSYSGNWHNGLWNGYGVLTLTDADKESIAQFKSENHGKYVDESYVIEGIFEDGYLTIECQKADCPAK